MSSQLYAKVIVNPAAGSRSTGKKWPKIREALTQSGIPFDSVLTEAKGHAIELAKEAAEAGYELVVAMGGDGTLNEVVNGLVASGNEHDSALGIVNTGTGCDFARYLGISRNHKQTCLRLINPRKMRADVGVVEYQSNGQRASRYFISAAGLGFDGQVMEIVTKQPSIFYHGTTPYVFGILHSLVAYKNKDVRLHIDDEVEDMRILSVIIANAGYYGGGMHVAPEADLDDGLFEVIAVGDVGKLELLWSFPKVYRGKHVDHPKVITKRAARVDVASSEQILVQADGELLGEGPASFRILPSALQIVV